MDNRPPAQSWNDPPQLGYFAASQSGPKRSILNKRVPFTFNNQLKNAENQSLLSDGTKSSVENCASSLTSQPPVSPVLAEISSLKNTVSCKTNSLDADLCDSEKLKFVSNTLEEILNEDFESCHQKSNDINQRISLMKKSWSQMSNQVKDRMFTLAQELSNGNVDEALKIHCILMVENVREVKQWMVGIKHIIEMKKNKQTVDFQTEHVVMKDSGD